MVSKTVVLDNKDLDAMVADAKGEPLPEKPPEVPPAATDDEDENGLTAEEREQFTRRMKVKIGKKHGQLREAEEFAAAQYNQRTLAEKRAAALEAEIAALKGQKPAEAPAAPAGPPQRPTREGFPAGADGDKAYSDAWFKWQDDVIEYRVKEQLTKDKAAAEKARLEAEQAEAQKRLERSLEAAREAQPDFDEAVSSFTEPFPGHVERFLQDSELVSELLYHLGKNPEELKKIRGMRADRALVALARIESKLSPFASAKAPSGASPPEGEKPSQRRPIRSEPKAAPEPSQPRAAPVITPLPAGSASQVPDTSSSYLQARADWAKRNPHTNLQRRKRH